MANINYDDRIPNNVDLSTNKTLQRALEHWQPRFLDWWKDLGPAVFQNNDVYLRTATSVDQAGWATFGMVKMPEYRWGIFLAGQKADRTIGFGDNMGQPAWQVVPGEHRSTLRRLIVTQGDTEPASVEQQRALGNSAPSLYDLRNLFQVNVPKIRRREEDWQYKIVMFVSAVVMGLAGVSWHSFGGTPDSGSVAVTGQAAGADTATFSPRSVISGSLAPVADGFESSAPSSVSGTAAVDIAAGHIAIAGHDLVLLAPGSAIVEAGCAVVPGRL